MDGGKDDKKSGRGRLEVLKRQETIWKDVKGEVDERAAEDRKKPDGVRRRSRGEEYRQGGTDEQEKGGEIQGRGVLHE